MSDKGLQLAASAALTDCMAPQAPPMYQQAIALALVDIAESLRLIEQRTRDEKERS